MKHQENQGNLTRYVEVIQRMESADRDESLWEYDVHYSCKVFDGHMVTAGQSFLMQLEDPEKAWASSLWSV